MRFPLLVFLLPLFGASITMGLKPAITFKIAQQRAVGNDYIDMVLTNLRKVILDGGHDKVGLPSHTVVDAWYASLKLKEGWVKGLSHLYRYGDVTLDFHSDTNFVELTAALELRDIQAHYNFDWKCPTAFIFWWMHGQVNAKSKGGVVRAKLEWVAKPGSHPTLKEFRLLSIADASFDITGLGGLNWIADLIVDNHIDDAYIYPIIYKFVNNDAKKLLNELLQNVEIPVTLHNPVGHYGNIRTVVHYQDQ